MRKLDFYDLPRSLQDRFIESTRGAAIPVPLAAAPLVNRRALLWGLTCLLGVLAWAVLIGVGFGQLTSPWALGGGVQLGLHLLCATWILFFAFRAYGTSWRLHRLPFGEGVYLFPAAVIAVRGTQLSIYEPSDFSSFEQEGARLRLKWQNGQVSSFLFHDAERADKARQTWENGIKKWGELREEEGASRARLHPLVESGVPNPLASTVALKPPTWLRPGVEALLVLIVGGALGFIVFEARSVLSEKELYRAAVQENTVTAYQAYLARGGQRAEVSSLFLPRAELELAMKQGTVEAIEAFIESHPHPEIAEEVRAIHRAALLRELEAAKLRGTLTALEELRQRYPAHTLIEAELVEARRQVFAQALARFQERAREPQGKVVEFMEKLLAYVEEQGPVVQVRWRHEFPQSREMLDSIVSRSEKYYQGQKSLPTQYFMGAPAERRETQLAQELMARWQEEFPADLLRWEYLGPSEEPNRELEEAQVPTVTLVHRESLSGSFVGGKPRAMYLGATVLLTARWSIPGQEEPLEFQWSTWRSPDFSLLVDSERDVPDVYEEMLQGAFQGFREAYLKSWFQDP